MTEKKAKINLSVKCDSEVRTPQFYLKFTGSYVVQNKRVKNFRLSRANSLY